MSDLRHQATWRLVADGTWEVEVHEGLPAHLPAHLRGRFASDRDSGPTLRCAASEAASIMAEIVKAAVWWEPRPMMSYRFRADRIFDVQFLRDTLEAARVEVSLWMPIPAAEGDVKVTFYADASLDVLRAVMASSPGGDRMRETLAAVNEGRADEPEPVGAPAAKGEA